MDQPTNQPTDRRTDIPSYRDAIALSKYHVSKKSTLREILSELIARPRQRLSNNYYHYLALINANVNE